MTHHDQNLVALTFAKLSIAIILISAIQGMAQDCPTTPLTGGTKFTTNGANYITGNSGYHYELWRDGSSGSMTVFGVDAAFKADWNNSGDFLARVGLKMDESKTYDKYGNIVADYTYTKTGTGGGYSFIGIYGWTVDPLVEYYIVDDWYPNSYGNSPPTGGGTLKGEFTIDGAQYKIYTFTRVNMPSIKGTQTFPQFFSVRQTPRQCGQISVSEHFKKWASLNLQMGKMYEAKLLLEAGGGTGTINYTKASIVANASTVSSVTPGSSSRVTLSSSSAIPVSQNAYSSVATIPGTVEAENYDLGGEDVAYHDDDASNQGSAYRTDGVDIVGNATDGYMVGYTIAGEWLEYSVNVLNAGAYDWEALVASNADGKRLHVLLDGIMELTGSVAIPNTGGWDTYGTVTGVTPNLSAGPHTLRIVIDDSYINIDKLTFSSPSVQLWSTSRGGLAHSLREFQVYSMLGGHIGTVKAADMRSLQAEVRKMVPNGGKYLIRSIPGSQAFPLVVAK